MSWNGYHSKFSWHLSSPVDTIQETKEVSPVMGTPRIHSEQLSVIQRCGLWTSCRASPPLGFTYLGSQSLYSSNFPSPHPLPLVTTKLISFSVNSVFCLFLDSTCKCSHAVFVFLTSLSIVPSRSIHGVALDSISSLLWLNNRICRFLICILNHLRSWVCCGHTRGQHDGNNCL